MTETSIQQAQQPRSNQDDWTGITARGERKKIQNRLNQRARRLRKQKAKDDPLSGRHPFRIQRWRIGVGAGAAKPFFVAQDSSENSTAPPMPLDPNHLDFSKGFQHNEDSFLQLEPIFHSRRHWSALKDFESGAARPANLQIRYPVFEFPLSPDHLLIHLIHYNVFRALTTNKSLLTSKATLKKPTDQGLVPLLPSFKDFCDGLTIIRPREDTMLPPLLYPTSAQMTIPHSSWINVFPFPQFRENLIEFEGIFDACDLCNDLFGEIFTSNADTCSSNSDSSEASKLTAHEGHSDFEEDAVATGRRGVIAWGEPWDKNGWEFTPRFVKKWAWLLRGCNDMIESGNRWRVLRKEKPLPLFLG